MIDQFSMFDAPPAIVPVRGDVLRIVQHKAGPFRELKKNGNGELTGREFRFVELAEHSLWIEFTDDGERRPAHGLEALRIEDGLRNGMFVEVAR